MAQQSRGGTGLRERPAHWRRLLGRWGLANWRQGLITTLQVAVGVLLGVGLARLMNLPEEQKALIGTLTTLVTWLADEAFRLPPRHTRSGKIVHGILRMLSLVGFMLALQSLAVLNGWAETS